MTNDENVLLPGPPPMLTRQITTDFDNQGNPIVPPHLNPEIVPDGVDPLLNFNGQSIWVPAPMGSRGINLEDFASIVRNNGPINEEGYEEEDVPTDEELEDDEEEEEEEVFNSVVNNA